MNKYKITAISVAGGITSGLAWTSWCPGLVLLVAFVPYFIIENHIYLNPGKYSINAFFIYLLPGFFIFSIVTLSWVRAANIPAAIAVIMEMSFLMSFIMWLAHVVRTRVGNIAGLTALLSFWLAFEYLSLHSKYLSPWINLGNGLAKDILFIQWFDITGTAGGTLWILLSNLLLTRFLTILFHRKKKNVLVLIIWLSVIIFPSMFSLIRYHTVVQSEKGETEVVLVQPNIDPFTEKYAIPFEEQLNKALMMTKNAVTEKTDWILLPETMIDDPVSEEGTENNSYLQTLRNFAGRYPSLNIICGFVSYRNYPAVKERPTHSARIIDTSGIYYDHFNSAFKIGRGMDTEIYHKSKLVPGIEMEFGSAFGKLIKKILPDMGGTIWGYGTQDQRTCFTHSFNGQIVAPVICYESVFGNYVAEYVRKGAEALFIITNDGWWKNTNGYYQHLTYSSLRAIETRRPVARCANTGISCIIDIRGKRIQQTGWWSKGVLKGNIYSETRTTFYVKYGDYIMKLALLMSILIIVHTFLAMPIRKKKSIPESR